MRNRTILSKILSPPPALQLRPQRKDGDSHKRAYTIIDNFSTKLISNCLFANLFGNIITDECIKHRLSQLSFFYRGISHSQRRCMLCSVKRARGHWNRLSNFFIRTKCHLLPHNSWRVDSRINFAIISAPSQFPGFFFIRIITPTIVCIFVHHSLRISRVIVLMCWKRAYKVENKCYY